jgi:hypothetical protein
VDPLTSGQCLEELTRVPALRLRPHADGLRVAVLEPPVGIGNLDPVPDLADEIDGGGAAEGES